MSAEVCIREGSVVDSSIHSYPLDPEKSFWIKIDDNIFFSLPFKQQNLISRGIVHAVGLTEIGELAEFDLSFKDKRGLMFGFKRINKFIQHPNMTPSVRCKDEALARLENSFGCKCEIIGPPAILPY